MMANALQRWTALGYWLHRAVGGVLVGLLFGKPIVGAVVGYPDPDAALTQPGSVLLLDVLSRNAAALTGNGVVALVLVSVWGLLGLLPLSTLLLALGGDRDDGDGGVSKLFSRVPKTVTEQALLSLVHAGLVAFVGLAGVLIALTYDSLFGEAGSARSRDMWLLVVSCPALALLLLTQPFIDLCRSAKTGGHGWMQTVASSARLLRERPGAVIWSWIWPQLAGVATLAACAWLSLRLSSNQPGALWSALALTAQQLGFLALTLGRVVWLANATRRTRNQALSAMR